MKVEPTDQDRAQAAPAADEENPSPPANPLQVVAAKKKLERLRRLYRFSCLMGMVGLTYGVWCLAVFPNQVISVTKQYDPTLGVEIETTACDVDLVAGNSPDITYAIRVHASKVRWNNLGSDANIVDSAYLGNSAGCGHMPFDSCRRVCLITVKVSDPTTTFQINQADSDKAWPIVRVEPGLTVGRINLGYWWKALPTLSLFVDNATVTSGIGGRLQRGDVRAHNATLGDVSLAIVDDGSFYLLDLQATGKQLDLSYRTPSNHLCLATDEPNTVAVRAANFANCDWTDVLAGGRDNWLSWSFMRGAYDPDSDGYVTKGEFTTALGKMKCCGGSCPFASWCESETYDVGLNTATEYAASKLLVNSFGQNLMDSGHSEWAPWCKKSLAVEFNDSSTPGPAQALSGLHTERGAVVVSLRQSATPKPYAASFFAPEHGRVFADEGRLPGLRLLPTDAQYLMGKYGSTIGNRDSTGIGFVVIEVQRADCHDCPLTRWYYASNPAFLILSPPMVTFLSASMLTPPLSRERVRFVDNGCQFNSRHTNETLWNETLVEMQHMIHKSLLSSAYDNGELRGQLVLLGDALLDPWGTMQLYHFPRRGDTRVREVWTNEVVSGQITVSIALSSAAGVLLGLILVAVAYHYLSFIQRAHVAKTKAARAVVLSKMGLTDEQLRQQQRENGDGGPNSRGVMDGNPFQVPFSLLSNIFITPLRARMVNSLFKFVRERMKLRPIAPGDKTFIYLRQFARKYELFCLENDLNIISSRDEIQRELILRYDCRFKVVVVRRIQGMRWREPYDPPKSREPVPEATERFSAYRDKDEVTARSVRAFIAERCVADLKHSSYLDFETRIGPSGKERVGFRRELFEWCKAQGRPTPNLQGTAWTTALPDKVTFRSRQKERELRGLEYDLRGDNLQLTWKWFLLELITVALHYTVMVLPALLFLFYSMVKQNYWGVYLCPAAGVNGQAPLLWIDILNAGPPSDRYVTMLPKVVAIEALAFIACTFLRMVLSYTGLPNSNPVVWATKSVYALFLACHLVFFASYIGVISCWFVLAAVLEPSKFLPYGVAVLVIVLVASTISHQMLAAASKFKKKLFTAFDAMMQMKMKTAIEKLERELWIQAAAADGSLASEVEVEGHEAAAQPERKEHISPADLFMALDKDGNDQMSMAEFREMFALLQLNLSESQQDQLFAYCDVDTNGTISSKEFQDGWDKLVKVFLENGAATLGLSKAQIFLAVTSITVFLILLFSFVLVTLAAWSNESSFAAVVQSGLISGAGLASNALRQRSKAESDDVGGLVDKIMDDQQEAADEAA